MLPVILGIAASAARTALTTGQALAIGTGIGVVSANLLKNKERQQREGDVPDDDELDELVELLEERLLRRKKKKG